MLRRTFVAILAAVAAALPWSSEAQPEPIRIGFLTVRSGPLAAGGKQMEEGIQLLPQGAQPHVRRTQGGAHHRRHRRQSGARENQDPGAGRENKVDVIIGPLATFEALAIDDYILQPRCR